MTVQNTDPRAIAANASPELMADRAYRALVMQLRDGRLASGNFLSIPMLVDQLEMPTAAVRDAVKRAETSGLFTVIPKRGVMVMDAGAQTTRECLDLRAMFDCDGARRLIQSGDDIPLQALRHAHERLRDDVADTLMPGLSARAIETDLSLHDALSAGIRSTLAARLYSENRDRIAVIQNTRPFLPDRIASAMTEHLAIISALEARDVEATVEAIRDHLDNTLRWWGVSAC